MGCWAMTIYKFSWSSDFLFKRNLRFNHYNSKTGSWTCSSFPFLSFSTKCYNNNVFLLKRMYTKYITLCHGHCGTYQLNQRITVTRITKWGVNTVTETSCNLKTQGAVNDTYAAWISCDYTSLCLKIVHSGVVNVGLPSQINFLFTIK